MKSTKTQGVTYLDGIRLRIALIAGANAVINDRSHLNRINVFPVPDADTGTNLASTMQAVAGDLPEDPHLGTVLKSASDAALNGCRGNSGIIFAQFLHGLTNAMKDQASVMTRQFSEAVAQSVRHVQDSLAHPVEGTILTVMRSWSNHVTELSIKMEDFQQVLTASYHTAVSALEDTPKQLAVLAEAGVVDSGAKGFVDLLSGIVSFLKSGDLRKIPKWESLELERDVHHFTGEEDIAHRYCTEALLTESQIDFISIKRDAEKFGDSVVVAGSPERLRLHVHTNRPAELFDWLRDQGQLSSMKAEDMQRQFDVSHRRKYPIALVTDSACDLPQELIEKYQIHVIPFTLTFGENSYLDKVTITPQRFYQLLETDQNHPTTAIPGPASVANTFAFLKTHYPNVISVHISGGLSGMYQLALAQATDFPAKELQVIDSKQLSVSQGLLVHRIAQAIDEGMSYEDIISHKDEWIANTHVLVDVATLKYMVRGGRVSPMKGMVANLLNLKPIITLDQDGHGTAHGKSFSRGGNAKKIVRWMGNLAAQKTIRDYAIVHAGTPDRANQYRRELTDELGKPPLYVEEVSPVIGAHNGIGVVGVGVITE